MPYKDQDERRQKHAAYRRKRRALGLEPKQIKTERDLERGREYRQEKRSELALRSYAWRQANPEAYRRIMRRNKLKKYGMTLEQFDAMLEAQGGVCAICKVGTKSLLGDTLSIDHDHKSGKVRGLLCGSCNTLIGHAREDAVVLEAAISYIRRHAPVCEDAR